MSDDSSVSVASPWMVIAEAAAYLRLSSKTIYRAVEADQLRAARVGGRRSLRFKAEWLDEYMERCAPQESQR